jgi:hypothetical protein
MSRKMRNLDSRKMVAEADGLHRPPDPQNQREASGETERYFGLRK